VKTTNVILEETRNWTKDVNYILCITQLKSIYLFPPSKFHSGLHHVYAWSNEIVLFNAIKSSSETSAL
jgi:hypothetical protein